MALILSGKKTVYINYGGFVTVDFNGQKMDLPIMGNPTVDVPFTKFVNLIDLFRDNMDFYDKYCSELKGVTNIKDRVTVSKEFIKANILSYITEMNADGTDGTDETDTIEIYDVDFMNGVINSDGSASTDELSGGVIINIMNSLQFDRLRYREEQTIRDKLNNITKMEKEKTRRIRLNNKRNNVIASRIKCNIRCQFGDRCYYKDPTLSYPNRPCRHLHPSDIAN